MEYELTWEPKAEKVFNRLQKNIKERFLNKLEELQQNPFRFLKHFEGREAHKLKVGKYRFLIRVDTNQKLLTIEDFDNRGRVYVREPEEEYCKEKSINLKF